MKTLVFSIDLSVRFSETDAMGVVWHGNYLKFFEDAREGFGKKYGIEYLSIHKHGFFAPIVKSEITHKTSVYYGDEIEVRVELVFLKAAKIKFLYKIYNKQSKVLVAEGSTIQVFLDCEKRELELCKPLFYSDWEEVQEWIEC
jgi:acyl-CoA thioester hydrolase